MTIPYLLRAETWLFITTLIYFLMNGAQLFETTVIVPKWTKDVPASFSLLQGPYAPDLKKFWVIVHSIHEVTFLIAVFFCWHLAIRDMLVRLLAIHFGVRAWTILYFAPNIMAFQKISTAAGANAELTQKVSLWRNLNYLRVGIFIAISFWMALLCVNLLHLLK